MSTGRKPGAGRLFDLGTRQGIAEAAELAKQLKALYRRKSRVVLDAGMIERIDTAAIQVLLAFAAGARERGIAFEWKALSGPAREALFRVGAHTALEVPES